MNRKLTPPWCCGMRMIGNETDGYRCAPHPRLRVNVATALSGRWYYELTMNGTRLDFDFASGPRAAANAATKALELFARTLTTQLARKP
jgi:hypothetical protein